MKIIAVDDERPALFRLTAAIWEALPEAELTTLRRASETLALLETGFCPDIAFLDIELPGMSGLQLAQRIRKYVPEIKIVFVTGFSQYGAEAYALQASDYLMKPVTAQAVGNCVERLCHIKPLKTGTRRLAIQTFGNFGVSLNGKPVKFKYSKTTELLAYLVDRRGAQCSSRELCAVLWEDQGTTARLSYLRNLRADLLDTLTALDCGDAITRQRGSLGVAVENVDCDYYRYLAGDQAATRANTGEYMAQYSWADFTLRE